MASTEGAGLAALLGAMLPGRPEAPLAVASRAAAATSSAPDALLRLVIAAVAAGEDVDLPVLRGRAERDATRSLQRPTDSSSGAGPATSAGRPPHGEGGRASDRAGDRDGFGPAPAAPSAAPELSEGPAETAAVGGDAAARQPAPVPRDASTEQGGTPVREGRGDAQAWSFEPAGGQLARAAGESDMERAGTLGCQDGEGTRPRSFEAAGKTDAGRAGTPGHKGAEEVRDRSSEAADGPEGAELGTGRRSEGGVGDTGAPGGGSPGLTLPGRGVDVAQPAASGEAAFETANEVPDGGTDWDAVALGLDGEAAGGLEALLAQAAAEDPRQLGRVLAGGGRGRPDRFATVAGLAACERLAVRLAPGAVWAGPAVALLADAGEAVGAAEARRVLGRSLLEEALTGRPSAAGLVRRLTAGLAGGRAEVARALAAGVRLAAARHPPAAVAQTLASLAALGPPEATPAAPGGEASRATRASGLVIVAPHLPALFERLGVTERGRLEGLEAAARALDVLAAVLHGDAEAPAGGRPLERLLCGLPEDLPLPPPVPLAPEAMATVDAMLEAVVAQWAALGRTSVEGLREAFLRRDGLLRPAPAGATLEVSPRAYDMLLDRLPWPLAVVKTRWMEVPLHVVWRK